MTEQLKHIDDIFKDLQSRLEQIRRNAREKYMEEIEYEKESVADAEISS